MRLHTVTKSLAAASANNIALSQSLAAAGALTLNGAAVSGGVATLDSQRRVILTSVGDDSGITWTVIGTNQDGSAIRDSFAGATAGAAAQSNLDFLTVTSITASGATAGNVTAGTNGVGSSPWQLMNDTTSGMPNLGIGIAITGTINVTVEYCNEDFLVDPSQPQSAIAFAGDSPNPTVYAFGPLQGLTADASGAIDFQIRGYRITINSGTGTVKMTTQQAGLSSP